MSLVSVPYHGSEWVRRFNEIAAVRRVHDGWRVTTQCMYPSNGLVEVTVREGVRTVVVSDEGGAVGEALSAGVEKHYSDKLLRQFVKDQGLLVQDGVIFTPQTSLEAADIAILHVANASHDVARWLCDHQKVKRTRDFRALLAAFLNQRFEKRVAHDALIVGRSNKPHKFANVISFHDGRRLIVDPVVNEAASINARIVANLDIKAIDDPLLHQRIVYDDEEKWTPYDLNLLQVGAPVVRFSRSPEVIEKLANG